MLGSTYLVTFVTSNSELNFLHEIPHFEPHLETDMLRLSLVFRSKPS